MYVADIHCHILAGVDDGSRDEDMSLDMLGIAYDQGIRKLVLTPHYYPGKSRYNASQLKAKFEEFKVIAHTKYPELDLFLGNEIYWSKGVVEELKAGLVNTMADTRYVLVEFSPASSYKDVMDAIRSLVNARFRPIIAHVERYNCLTRHIDRIGELIDNGAYLQMNADSLVGSRFDSMVRWCRSLMTNGYISMLGTDAHNLEDRAPYVEQTVEWMKKKLPGDMLDDILHGNAERMINNEFLD